MIMINTMFGLFNLGGMEIILILALVLILFGAKKLPELAKGLGQGIKEFKKATKDVTDEMHRSMEDNSYSQSAPKPIQDATPPASQPASPPEKTVVASTTVPTKG
jgi:sec-independent protein translocase protein TatA